MSGDEELTITRRAFEALQAGVEQRDDLEAELRAARQAARVLAHAWDHDASPPAWALELARGWDAYGKPIPARHDTVLAAHTAKVRAWLGPGPKATPSQVRAAIAEGQAADAAELVDCDESDP